MSLHNAIRKITPRILIRWYHTIWAVAANVWYRFPSKEIIVIGVTGTNGKSTTCNLIARVLEGNGIQTGLLTTVNYKVGNREWLNDTRMTMLGRFHLQRMLRDMVRAGCRYAVIETSSEGLMQNRHWGIRYDVAVFTNLTPEHLEAHGGFDAYKRDKGKLFSAISTYPRKRIAGTEVHKAIVVNTDDPHAKFFSSFTADAHYTYGIHSGDNAKNHLSATRPSYTLSGTTFTVQKHQASIKLVGEFNVYNALAALCVATHFGVPLTDAISRLQSVVGVPGRMELISAGQPFTVLVDYAHDEESFHKLFETLALFEKKRIIHVFGSAGGVRDHAKRPRLGAFSDRHADVTILTDEDSYDEPVRKILNEIAAGMTTKKISETLYLIEDRAEAIAQACKLAQPGDLVLITGKGAEQNIKSNGQVRAWDDRIATRTALAALGYTS